MMKLSTFLLSGAALAALAAVSSAPAQAGTVCPTGGNVGVTGTTGCNVVITFQANGAITTAFTGLNSRGFGTYSYDAGNDDALIGVVNDSSKAIGHFTLGANANDIFGFDGDGVGSAAYLNVTNALDTSYGAYGGQFAYFTNIAGAYGPGTVNFIGGIAANGGTSYFSLEEAASLTGPPTVTGVPEPSTWAMMALGFAGLGFAGYRGRKKVPSLA
jgi:hypothetical protein